VSGGGNEVLGFYEDVIKTSTLAETVIPIYLSSHLLLINYTIYIVGIFADTHE
jgi:hypothetical protein